MSDDELMKDVLRWGKLTESLDESFLDAPGKLLRAMRTQRDERERAASTRADVETSRSEFVAHKPLDPIAKAEEWANAIAGLDKELRARVARGMVNYFVRNKDYDTNVRLRKADKHFRHIFDNYNTRTIGSVFKHRARITDPGNIISSEHDMIRHFLRSADLVPSKIITLVKPDEDRDLGASPSKGTSGIFTRSGGFVPDPEGTLTIGSSKRGKIKI